MDEEGYLSKEEWMHVVKQRLSDAVEVIDWKLSPLNSTGGFLGEHLLASVTVRTRRSQEPLRFFIKSVPKRLEFQKEIVKESGSFEIEILVLQDLFAQFKSVLKNGGANMAWTCKFFYTRPDIIVMEDLMDQGYETIDNRGPITYEHIALAMKRVANLHSATLIYEERGSNKPFDFVKKNPCLEICKFFRPVNPGLQWMNTCVRAVWALVEMVRGKNELNRFREKIEETMINSFELQVPSNKYRNVFGQGDLKRDNILFRHENGMPVDAYIVDYQTVHYMPPANDVMCLLYISTDRKFREQYSAQLLKLYYDRLSENLKNHDLDPQKILSWEEFQESCEVYKTLGIRIKACYGPFTMMKIDNMSEVFASNDEFKNFVMGDRVPAVISSFKTDSVFRNLMTDVVEELLEYIESLE